MLKHTVIIIAYNVENYIRDALDSCLSQSVLPYEIIVGENCSTDSTREILLEFQGMYPNIIKIHFHETNIGEYGNRNYLREHVKVEGDIISLLDADDLFKPGMFEEFNNLIAQNNLAPDKEKFILVSNVVNLQPDGRETMFLHNFRYRHCSNFNRLKIRNRFGSRNTGISRLLYDEMPPWRSELGMWADYAQVVELYGKCDKYLFINKAFPVYRLGSGITGNKINNVEQSYSLQSAASAKEALLNDSYIATLKYLKRSASLVDTIYLNKEIYKTRNRNKFSASNLFLILLYKTLDTPAALKYDSLTAIILDLFYLLPSSISKSAISKIKGWAFNRQI